MSSGYGAVDASQSLDKDKALRKNRLDAFHDLVAQEAKKIEKRNGNWGIPVVVGPGAFLFCLRASANLRLGVGRDEEPVDTLGGSRPGP